MTDITEAGGEATWTEGDVEANGITIHYTRTGGDGPPLVLSHGATDSGRCWSRLAVALQGEFDVIMPDARGHGRSEAPEGDYGAGVRAADLAAFIAALGLERPAVGGHSMGAATTLRLIADAPHLASRAFLEDPGFRDAPPAGADWEARRERMRRGGAELKALGYEGIVDRGREQHPDWDPAELPAWADSKLRVSDRFVTSVRFPDRPDWRELLPRVACPVLLITADPQRGALVTPEMAAEAAALQPRLRVVRLEGAGHSVRRERFDPYLEAVRAFLSEPA